MTDEPRTGERFRMPLTVRYAECDQQGVVFNSHYLTWFDESMMAFLLHRGLDYSDMLEMGTDVQLVKNTTEWRKGVRWREPVEVAVSASRIGRSSFDLDFAVLVEDEVRTVGTTVYVAIRTDGSGSVAVPDHVRAALEPLVPAMG